MIMEKEIGIEAIKDLVRVQGNDGNWNYDNYMLGMYNGMELCLSILEQREPIFKSKPEVWGRDEPVDQYEIGVSNGY